LSSAPPISELNIDTKRRMSWPNTEKDERHRSSPVGVKIIRKKMGRTTIDPARRIPCPQKVHRIRTPSAVWASRTNGDSREKVQFVIQWRIKEKKKTFKDSVFSSSSSFCSLGFIK
jgi:hypothetical protein